MLKRNIGTIASQWLLPLLLILIYSSSGAAPVASFSANQTTGCSPLTVQFMNTSTGAVSWYWDLGNGNSSTLQNPVNVFTNPGSYSIKLVATDISGNKDSVTYSNYITVVGRPIADFNVNTTSACPDNNSFVFTNTSTNGATTYFWDFGDGSTSNAPSPTHSFVFAGTFTVTLIAINTFGCQDIKIANQLITIYPKPDPTIHVSDTADCDPATAFQFSNNAVNGATWTWFFGDMTTSNLQNPSHQYPGPGAFPVELIVTNIHGCADSSDNPIQINVGINNWSDFLNDIDSGCVPMTVNFTNNTNATIISSLWNFGDGGTSNQLSPTHVYTTGGHYTVSRVLQSNNGCADTLVRNNLINAGVAPTVNFQYTNASGCAPLSVQFTNTSTNYSTCEWFFGDGTSSTAVNPTHVYTNSGTFTVTLQCNGPTGCPNNIVKSNIITVTSSSAIFNATPRVGCPPLQTSFTTLAPANGLTYFWKFGDGTTSTLQNPNHNYANSGNYDVSLIVTDPLGCKDTIYKPHYIQVGTMGAGYVPPPPTTGCAPLTAQFTDGSLGSSSWLWNFGDGTTSNLQNPSHTYNTSGSFTVSLTTNSSGCVQSINNFSTFNVDGGYAGFSHSESPCPPYIATFNDTSMNAVSWLWDFGDGTTDTTQNPVHTYISPGYHSASLTITTAGGCTFTTVQNNGVYFDPFGANFYGIPLDTVFPAPVQFYANAVGATSWVWDFDDGGTSILENPLHIYQSFNSYNVSLTISNGTCTITYNPPPYHFGLPDTTPVDVGNLLNHDVQRGCLPLNVLFTNRVRDAVSWLWDFGDGSTSNAEFPLHQFTQPGIYTVTLTTTDSTGMQTYLQLDSIVRASSATAGFSVLQSMSCNNTQITFTDSSVNSAHWLWDFGDGTTDTIQNPVHAYNANVPNYIITQTVTDTMGCSSSISTSVFTSPTSPILVSESEICGHDTVDFVTTLSNFASYHWNFGDGQTSNQVNPSHIYNNEGVYTPTLTVTDLSGCTQTFVLSPNLTVKLPVADFTSTGIRQTCVETEITFINNSVNADSYLWNLGDGNTSSLTAPVHTYHAGIFDVSLTVYRGSCVSTINFPHYVRVDTAHAELAMSSNQACLPIVASFQNLSVNPVTWQWYFGDGDSSSVMNPVHIYLDRPYYFPFLIMTDINGCRDTALSPSMPVLKADYTTSGDSGCYPFPVQFNNTSSVIASAYYWDFGDGTTSQIQNPSHIYSLPGEYDVTLVITSTYTNCADTLFIPQKIKVRQPHADFVSTDLAACAPSIVNFTDLSSDADNYLWDFGDGMTSTNVNPAHIYNIPGIYTVKLVTTSGLGCADSITKVQYVHVLGPITKFGASSVTGCSPITVTFIDSSINAVRWNWSFGDGYTDTITNPVHVFQDSGSFTVSLVAFDTSGCSSFFELPQPVIVKKSPVGAFHENINGGCQPLTVNFTNNSTGHISSMWNFGDGDTTSVSSPVHLFTDSGSFDVQLVVTNSIGCTDTAYGPQPVDVFAAPVPVFTVQDTAGCAPFHVTFINQTSNTSNAQYFWNFGNGTTSTDPNPVAEYIMSGTYNVTVTVTNVGGCNATFTYPVTLLIIDSVPPPETKMLSVSVISDTEVKLIWENNPALDLSAFVIYRKTPMNTYQIIQYINNTQNTNFALTNEYVDSGLNTLLNTYTYKVQALNLCGNAIPLDSLTAHTTVNVSSYLYGDDIAVSWTPYGGCPVSSYEIYRAAPNEPFTYLLTVPPATLNFLDTTFVCPVTYTYRITATDLCGNTYTSYSDTSQTIPINTLDSQVVNVVRSTVVDNLYVLTEWAQPVIHPELVAQFDVYRSTDNENFYYVKTVPSLQTDYVDYDVDVQNKHYYYKVLVVNTCNISEDLSDFTSTIILKGSMTEGRIVHLEWTPYLGWDSGVDYYIIEVKDPNGNWQLLRQVTGNTLIHDYQE